MADLFDDILDGIAVAEGDAESSAEAEVAAADDPGTILNLPAGYSPVMAGGLSPWFSVAVLTVPDLDRFPVPKEFDAEKVPVDLADMPTMTMGEVRRLITATLPHGQLESIYLAEISRDKPRPAVLKAIASERADRGPGFENWVLEHARHPLMCRVAAVAWRSESQSVVVHAPATLEEEAAALSDLRRDFDLHRTRCRGNYWPAMAALDLQLEMQVVTARRQKLGIENSGDDFRPVEEVCAAGWLSHIRTASVPDRPLCLVAESLGVPAHDIPDVPSVMRVFLEWRENPGSVALQDWCVNKLTLESDLLRIIRNLW